jgi:ABC-type branched-subunit amino acid transport system ATPase component/ABC-type branched-subunit amino acid transport system permease subunit
VPRFRTPTFTTAICAAASLACIAAGMSSDYYLTLLIFSAIYVIATMGLNVQSGYANITSIGHGALVCLGAYATALTTARYGWDFWPACALSVVTGMAFSMVLGLPALRLSSWYFVLITIAFTLTVTGMLTDLRSFTGGYSGIVGVKPPALFGAALGPKAFFILLIAIIAALWWSLSNIMHSRIGWALHAIREGNVRAQANGVSIVRLRLFAFLAAGALAGLAGSFYASAKIVITPEEFGFEFSIFFLFIMVLGGPARLAGPLLGVLTFYVLPELLGSLKENRMIAYGIGLLLFSVFLPEGLAGLLSRLDRRMLRARRSPAKPAASSPDRRPGATRTDGVALKVQGITKNFGGVRALDTVSMEVRPGCIHAIVGPNGSGKTTLLNVISGFYPASAGDVTLGDAGVSGLSPTRVARMGVQRTFQTPKLLNDLTVLENTRFGGYAREQASAVEIALSLPRARNENARLDDEALALLGVVGLAHRAQDRAGELPHGQQRLVEIARAMAGRPRLLLLDEPAAGLSLGELEEFGRLMLEMRASGMTLVMVEHHIELVANIADWVTVLDQGRVLADGPPQEIFRSAEVVSAYTGAVA